MSLADMVAELEAMPEAQRIAAVAFAAKATAHMVGIPQPGPQTRAYHSKADVLLFGGQPGGGKTGLEVLLSLNEHHRALIVRKNFVDLEGVLHTLDNIVGRARCWVGGNRPRYDKPGGGVIDFMGLGNFEGKQGNPHDLICVDEAAQIPEHDFRMLRGWLRSDKPGQRKRIVLASNPPLDTTGDWLVEYFAPWLDDNHPNPAADGELRYFLPKPDGDGWVECEAGDTMVMHGTVVAAESRTFIRSSYTDNAYYDPGEYAKTLAALPDSARRRLMTGNFMADREDDEWQVIPTAWVQAAVERWTSTPPVGIPMSALGVDVAQGGADQTVIARRHDGWYAPLLKADGKDTPNGSDVAGIVLARRHDNAKVILDVGGGWGADAHGHLRANDVDCEPYMGVKSTLRTDKDRQYKFANVRSAAYWLFREALDPGQRGGSRIMLPNDKRLISGLCSPRYRIKGFGTGNAAIEVESKLDVVERLKRSPDEADAVVMAWWSGPKMEHDWKTWPASLGGGRFTPRVVSTGRAPLSARIGARR